MNGNIKRVVLNALDMFYNTFRIWLLIHLLPRKFTFSFFEASRTFTNVHERSLNTFEDSHLQTYSKERRERSRTFKK